MEIMSDAGNAPLHFSVERRNAGDLKESPYGDRPTVVALRESVYGFLTSNLIVFKIPASFGISVSPVGNLFA